MINTTFGSLKVGQVFYVNDKEYTKLKNTKITCCKSINCQESSNASKRAFFKDSTPVQILKENG
jgi:hypothetical protein